MQAVFEPRMSGARRTELVAGWQRALNRALTPPPAN